MILPDLGTKSIYFVGTCLGIALKFRILTQTEDSHSPSDLMSRADRGSFTPSPSEVGSRTGAVALGDGE
ncbi:MAG: hypothetical protein GTO12_06270 [Proteobacteria bacterium]|nr:hypothetical protein [Pseudomonadota bacterium]